MTDLRERIARQLVLEDEGRQLGADRYRAARPLPWRTDASSANEEAELPPGRQLLKLAVEPTAAALRDFLTRINSGGAGRRPSAAKLLSLADPEEAAYLAVRVVVNHAVLQSTAQAAAMKIATALIDHVEMTHLRQANKAGYKGLIKAQERRGYSSKKRDAISKLLDKEGVSIQLGQSDRLQTGMKMIELICESTGLFALEQTTHRKGVIFTLRPTEACRDWLERQHARCEILEPILMPMVVRPRRWRTPFWGGYLTKRPGLRLVKQWDKPYHDEIRFVDMPEVYRAVNNIQGVPWRINRRVLEVMRAVWDGGGSLGGLPRRDDLPIPPRPPEAEGDPEVHKRWKAAAADVHTQNAQLLSKRLAMAQRLWVSQKFADEEAIWFPHEIDFRGRVYPIPNAGPHPQGDDAAKGLLEFARGVPLGTDGPGWLAVHIANLFGVDKVPFEERVDWVMAHHDEIMDSADNPLDGHRFWTTADSPYCALAACIEWAGYTRDGPDFVSHIPVALDGSNSGLQHFSAMLRDPVGATAVNLLPADRPQDVYMQVAGRAQAFVDADESDPPPPHENSADDPVKVAEYEARWRQARDAWKGGKIVRKIAKRPCMTYCYSATRFGMQDMVFQTLREIDAANAAEGKPPHLNGADNYEAAKYLSHVLWDAIAQVVAAASSAMDWLRSAAKIAGEAGLPLWWTTPQGLPVLQAYRSVHARRIDVHYAGRRLQVTMAVDGDEIDRRAMANGIAPNFVHSLDASHLMAVVNACADAGLEDVAVIHDSFGTHAANAGHLSVILRETFVEQYQPNRLEEFRDQLAAQLPPELTEKLPPLPPLGSLDLNEVLRSEYVFA